MFELEDKIDAGVGHSDFQVAPEPLGEEPVTDWEKELTNAREGVARNIKGAVYGVPDFHRDYKKHVDLAKDELNNGIFRMSLDFGRLCPKEGEFDHWLMAHYIRMLAYCRKRGVEPLVTLHHWPMPISYCEYEGDKIVKGGWEHPEILDHFKFYMENVIDYFLNPDKIRKVLKATGDFSDEEIDQIINEGIICKSFITINEPVNYYLTPYIAGIFPPFKKGAFSTAGKVLDTVAEAHDIAYSEMHEAAATSPEINGIRSDVNLGVAHNMMYFEGKSWFTKLIAKWLDRKLNWDLIDRFEEKGSDFFGVQYYFRQEIGMAEILRRITGKNPKDRQYCDHPEFGDIYPEGIQKMLMAVKENYPEKDVKVTEFGFADAADERRPYWIMETVRNILEAKEKGVRVDTISLWSIINNFEWAEGMDMQFGLYDHHGHRLPSDKGGVDGTRGGQISSRKVWATLSTYLNNPSEENRATVVELYKYAKNQFEKAEE